MSDMLEHLIDVVKVHIIRDDTKEPKPVERPKQPREIRATFQTFQVSSTTIDKAVLILRHAPNRIRAIIQITTGGPVTFAATQADSIAADNKSAQWQTAAAGPIEMFTTNEVWAASGAAGVTNIAVIAEYEEKSS